MYGVVCLSILLERVTVSNNFTKRRQNGFKIGTRDKFAVGKLYFKGDGCLHTFLCVYDWRFPHTILYIHKLSHTPRILSLGILWLCQLVMSSCRLAISSCWLVIPSSRLVNDLVVSTCGPVASSSQRARLTLRQKRQNRQAQAPRRDSGKFSFTKCSERHS